MAAEPDLDAVRALTLAATGGSISAAAAHLGISQQAVSARIRALESSLDAVLLVRSARGSRLTTAGELVVGWAAPLLAAADDFAAAAAALRTDRRGTVRVAASLTIAEHLLPAWVAAWHTSTGDDGPAIRLEAANSTAVIEAVRSGSADLGFIETPVVPGDLGSVVVARDAIVVVVPRGHPWATRGRVSAADLAATSLVVREAGSGTRQALEDALAHAGHGDFAAPAAVLSTTLAVRSAVMGGLAPGALSSLAVADDIRAARLVPVPIRGLRIERPLTAVWLGAEPSATARKFLEVVAAVTAAG